MAPKKEPKVSKADQAKKQKIAEDKTFGLKNKNKSKAVQQYVKQIQQSAQNPNGRKDPKEAQKKKKEEEAAREKELNEIFKVAITQPKVPLGVDPKSIVCEFFRHGQCAKGFKCKFSHDLSVERKGPKIDLYSDKRDNEEEEDMMEDWDQEKLESVVASKGNEYKNANKPTDIVCKHFLEAVESKKYGWFWVCPNGGKECMYRHALPPGYVLKSQMKQLLEEEAQNKLSVEEQIEQERHMTKSQTKITAEVFAEWKQKKREAKEAVMAAKRAARAKEDRMSGRELFAADASLFVDDAEACDAYERDQQEEERQQQAQQQQQAQAQAQQRLQQQLQLQQDQEQLGVKQADGTDSESCSTATSSSATAQATDGQQGCHVTATGNGQSLSHFTEEDEQLFLEDDDDLDPEELEELEASLADTSIQDRP